MDCWNFGWGGVFSTIGFGSRNEVGTEKNIEKAQRLSRQALGEIVEKEPQESVVFILTKMLRPYFHVIRVVSSKLKKKRIKMQLHSR